MVGMNGLMRGAARVVAGLALTAGLIVAGAVAGWWRIGDISDVPPSENPDYAMTPPDFPPGLEKAAGIAAMVVIVGVLAALMWATVTRRLNGKWWLAVLPAIIAGDLLALAGRVMTAGVIGANIGAGFAVVIFGPIALILAVVAVVLSIRLLGRRGGFTAVTTGGPVPRPTMIG
jgi:hypothetical protein